MNAHRFLVAALAVAAIGFTACSDEEPGFHSTSFYPIEQGGKVMYADQTTDSTHVLSYDSWTLRHQGDFITNVTPTALTIPNGYSVSKRIDITTTVNNTGASRLGAIYVTSSFDKIGTVMLRITQLPWLNIVAPGGQMGTDGRPDYNLQLKGATTSLTDLTFVTYSPEATLSSTAEWLRPEQTTFEAGRHENVKVTLDENDTNAPRTAQLILTSAGISDTINVQQLKK